jgi:protoheme IX farnesyltransferase
LLREYYRLTKPGIIYGNSLPAIAGFLLASKGHVAIGLLIAMLSGLGAVIGASCVYNNYLDRGIDKLMARTKKRALVSGAIKPLHALIFATLLALLGGLLLGLFTNALTLGIAVFGMIAYVGLYGYGKRHTVHGTLIGSISGAVPPVVGYCAVTGQLDLGAFLLFMILVFWQMPHFYAIALYRAKDYKAAGLPVLPVVSGAYATKIQIILYADAFLISCVLLTIYGYTGYTYLATMVVLGGAWVIRGLRGLKDKDEVAWGRKMFLFSLIVLCVWSLMVSLTAWLP